MIIGKTYSNPTCVSEKSSLNEIIFKDIKKEERRLKTETIRADTSR